MSVKRVLQYGEKSLREPSKEVHKVSKKIQELVQDLLDTMYAKNGVGMAAPQIGVNYRVFVIDVSKNDEPLNPIVFINPKIIPTCLFLILLSDFINRALILFVEVNKHFTDGTVYLFDTFIWDGAKLSSLRQHRVTDFNFLILSAMTSFLKIEINTERGGAFLLVHFLRLLLD